MACHTHPSIGRAHGVSNVIEPTDIDGEGGVFLHVGGEAFECRKVSVTWHMMRFAKAQKAARAIKVPDHLPKDNPERKAAEEKQNELGMDLLAVMYDVIMVILKPHERERFEEFMSTAEVKPQELEDAIGEAIAEIGGGKGKVKQATTSPSVESQPNTNGKSPAVSSTPDTATESSLAELSSTYLD
jgi:hypothetical protein